MAEIKSLLDGVIETEIENLKTLETGSEEKSKAVSTLSTLHKLRIEEIKAETEAEDKRQRREMEDSHHKDEMALKKEQTVRQEEQQKAELSLRERQVNGEELDRERDETFKKRQFMDGIVDRYVKLGVAVAELVLPLAFYGTWMKMGFEFEKEGTFTSSTFKNLFNRFKPTRKG